MLIALSTQWACIWDGGIASRKIDETSMWETTQQEYLQDVLWKVETEKTYRERNGAEVAISCLMNTGAVTAGYMLQYVIVAWAGKS